MRILLILLVLPLAAAAQQAPTADSLRAKYRNTDIIRDFQSISFDIRVKDPVPKGYKLYSAIRKGMVCGIIGPCPL